MRRRMKINRIRFLIDVFFNYNWHSNSFYNTSSNLTDYFNDYVLRHRTIKEKIKEYSK